MERHVIQVNWQEQVLAVRRLVFRRGHERGFDAALDRLAARFGLEVTDDRTDPRPGDFWLGCHPRAGWGAADPERIGWASAVEVPLAVGVLLRAAGSEPRTDQHTPDTPTLAVAFGAL
jgi:hypothetical protein